jgi:hypothetical protein
VPPQQEYFLGLVDDGRRGDRALPDQEVIEMASVGQLHISEVHAKPAIPVHELFALFRPTHVSATFHEEVALSQSPQRTGQAP